jgi:putative holliday junction resolvase
VTRNGGEARTGTGRAVGIDLGTRRIGIAVTDSAGTMALPRTTVHRTGDAQRDRRTLVELVLDEGGTVVVVGLPLSLDGSRGPAAKAAAEEADALRDLLEVHGIAVVLFDERLTTVTAQQALVSGGTRRRNQRGVVDQSAAAVMLGAWLDTGRGCR